MKKKITVGLMGHSFHCSNLGVGALALSECAILEKIALELNCDLEVVCFESGWSEECYIDATSVKARQEYYTFSPSMIRKFKQCDLIIDVTGGDSFSDIYGNKIFVAGILLKYYAVLSGKPIILAPQTIGPFFKKRNCIIANRYMNHVKSIFIRDKMSNKVLSEKNCGKTVSVADMAFKLPYEKGTKKENVIGFNVSGLLYDKSNRLVNRENFSYESLCDKLVKLLLDMKYKVVLVSHVIGDEKEITDNDYCASVLMKKKFPELEIAPVFKNPIEAKSYISTLDMFIGSRMHAVIAALSSGVPSIPIAYSRKFMGVFEPLGYTVTLDARKLDEDQIVEKVKEYITNNLELKRQCDNVQNKANELLGAYEECLKDEISNILKRKK